MGQGINHEEQIFNDALASPWISLEQAIGMWKGRYPWLWSICMKHTSSKMSVQHIIRMIEACEVLHNYLIEENNDVQDNWRDDSDISGVNEALSEDYGLNNPFPQLWPNDHQYTQLKNYINDMYAYT